MVGPDALLIPLDKNPVRARAPRLDPAISLERRQDTRSLGHAQHRRAPVRQSAQEARCQASAGTRKQVLPGHLTIISRRGSCGRAETAPRSRRQQVLSDVVTTFFTSSRARLRRAKPSGQGWDSMYVREWPLAAERGRPWRLCGWRLEVPGESRPCGRQPGPAAFSAPAHRRGAAAAATLPRTRSLAVPAVTHPGDRACRSRRAVLPRRAPCRRAKDHRQERSGLRPPRRMRWRSAPLLTLILGRQMPAPVGRTAGVAGMGAVATPHTTYRQ